MCVLLSLARLVSPCFHPSHFIGVAGALLCTKMLLALTLVPCIATCYLLSACTLLLFFSFFFSLPASCYLLYIYTYLLKLVTSTSLSGRALLCTCYHYTANAFSCLVAISPLPYNFTADNGWRRAGRVLDSTYLQFCWTPLPSLGVGPRHQQ